MYILEYKVTVIVFDHSLADIDECTMYTGLCEDICNNTEGSYFCACSEGYVLSNDSRTCDGKTRKRTLSLLLSKLVYMYLLYCGRLCNLQSKSILK